MKEQSSLLKSTRGKGRPERWRAACLQTELSRGEAAGLESGTSAVGFGDCDIGTPSRQEMTVLKFMSEIENTGSDELTSWAEDTVNDLLEGVRRHSCSFSV